jgi:hypothetical protein
MLRMPFIVVALLVLLPPAARADGAQSAQVAAKAAADLMRYADDAAKKNERPAFDKSPASTYLGQVLDGKALAALPPPNAKDMSWLVQWADAMNKVNQLLIFTGAKSSSEADQRAAIERNMTDYEDVMFPAWAFMARLQARMLLSADLFMDEARGPQGSAERAGENPRRPHPVRPRRPHHDRRRRQATERKAPGRCASRDGTDVGAPHQRAGTEPPAVHSDGSQEGLYGFSSARRSRRPCADDRRRQAKIAGRGARRTCPPIDNRRWAHAR